MKTFILALAGLPVLLAPVRAINPVLPDQGYAPSRYETLWTKSPFAIASPDPVQTSTDYSLVGLVRMDGVSYASLIDKQTGEHFLLSSRKSVRGLQLISISRGTSHSNAYATLLKDGRAITVKIEAPLQPEIPYVPGLASSSIVETYQAQNPVVTPSPPDGEKLPLVFHSVDVGTIKLNSDQRTALDNMRAQFLKQVQNPNDPQYAERWKKSQQELDQQVKSMLGNQVFTQYQLQAQNDDANTPTVP